MFFQAKKKWYKKTWIIVTLSLLLLLGIFRIFLPNIVLSAMNRGAAKNSPYISFHADAVDLDILSGRYEFKNVTGMIHPKKIVMASCKSLIMTIPWLKLITRENEMLILIDQMKLKIDKQLLHTLDLNGQWRAKKREQGSRPWFSVTHLNWTNAEIEVPELGKAFTNIDAHLTNLNPNELKPFSDFKLTSSFLHSSPLKLNGVFRFRTKPIIMDLDGEIKDFDLLALKPYVEEKTGIIIQAGKLDLFAEAKMEAGGKFSGYLKPFLKNLKVDVPKKAKQNELVKIIIKMFENKLLSTKLAFTHDKVWKTEWGKALKLAVEGKLKPGVENNIQLESKKLSTN
jgi:hypothetical protein